MMRSPHRPRAPDRPVQAGHAPRETELARVIALVEAEEIQELPEGHLAAERIRIARLVELLGWQRVDGRGARRLGGEKGAPHRVPVDRLRLVRDRIGRALQRFAVPGRLEAQELHHLVLHVRQVTENPVRAVAGRCGLADRVFVRHAFGVHGGGPKGEHVLRLDRVLGVHRVL